MMTFGLSDLRSLELPMKPVELLAASPVRLARLFSGQFHSFPIPSIMMLILSTLPGDQLCWWTRWTKGWSQCLAEGMFPSIRRASRPVGASIKWLCSVISTCWLDPAQCDINQVVVQCDINQFLIALMLISEH